MRFYGSICLNLHLCKEYQAGKKTKCLLIGKINSEVETHKRICKNIFLRTPTFVNYKQYCKILRGINPSNGQCNISLPCSIYSPIIPRRKLRVILLVLLLNKRKQKKTRSNQAKTKQEQPPLPPTKNSHKKTPRLTQMKLNKTNQNKTNPRKQNTTHTRPTPLPRKRPIETTKKISILKQLKDYKGYPELFHFVFQPPKKIDLERKPCTLTSA